MGDNVIPLNDSISLNHSFDCVLTRSKGKLATGVVIGQTEDGGLYIYTDISNSADLNWILDKAKQAILDSSLTSHS